MKTIRRRKSCQKDHRPSVASSSVAVSVKVGAGEQKPTSTKAASSKPSSLPGAGSDLGGAVGLKPANWPTKTQPGAAPVAHRTSPADPYLMELSKSYNNNGNHFYTDTHRGQMTYYGQGLGACGDTYNDQSFTAAVSKLMYDAWPGAWAGEMNRNPICGPFVPGRKMLNAAGTYDTVVPGSSFAVVGGDGYLNCAVSIGTQSQCHIPLTATVKHGSKSIIVKIVDRCEACAVDDIDLTPAAFEALADPGLGRTDVEWHFNQY